MDGQVSSQVGYPDELAVTSTNNSAGITSIEDAKLPAYPPAAAVSAAPGHANNNDSKVFLGTIAPSGSAGEGFGPALSESVIYWFRQANLMQVKEPFPIDPYIEIFKNDRVLLEMTADSEQILNEVVGQIRVYACCCTCLPQSVALSLPCSNHHAREQAEQAALSRRLILRENSLVFRFEAGMRKTVQPCCCDIGLHRSSTFSYDYELVFSLDDPISLSLDQCWTTMGSICPSVKSINIRYLQKPIAALDCPKGAEEFIRRFRAQQKTVQERGSSFCIRSAQRQKHSAIMVYARSLNEVPDPANYGKTIQYRKQLWAATQVDVTNNDAENVLPATPVISEMIAGSEPSEDLVQMSVADVLGVLEHELGLGHHCMSFDKAYIDGAMLSVLDDATLQELGVTSEIEKKRVLAWVVKNRHRRRQ